VSVGKLGKLVEQALAHALGFFELAVGDEVDGVVGHLGEPLIVLLVLVEDVGHPARQGNASWLGWRRVAALLVASGTRSRLIGGKAALLVFLAAAARTGLISSDLSHGSEMSLLKLFGEAKFYHALERIDAELAEAIRRARCQRCGGALHAGHYPRKPRGGPPDLPASYSTRASYCCAVDGCRKRATPPSVRFLARRVYLGAVVVLASAMQHGVSAFRAELLKALFGVSRQTLERWRVWWLEMFPASRFWQSLRGRFAPAVDESALPRSMLERFASTEDERSGPVGAVLRMLQPISTRPWLEASAS